jgi:hypothetical protein
MSLIPIERIQMIWGGMARNNAIEQQSGITPKKTRRWI